MRADKITHSFGFDPQQLDAILGDLAEEREALVRRYGQLYALLWWGREVLRSAPPLIADAFRRGTPAVRSRLFALLAAPVVVTAIVTFLVHLGPPVHLVVPGGRAVIINNTSPVRLDLQVFDSRGHSLDATGVRYTWQSGMPMNVSPAGLLTCERPARATVRASIGGASKDFTVTCLPVETLRAAREIDLVAGTGPRNLPFVALDAAWHPVMQLRGSLSMSDSSVAAIVGAQIKPLSAGKAMLDIRVGDRLGRTQIIVYNPAESFAGASTSNPLLAHHLRLAQGDTTDLPLPVGTYWVRYIPDRADEPPPTINLNGGVMCWANPPGDHDLAGIYVSHCQVHGDDARLTVGHGRVGPATKSGWVAIERVK